MWFWAEMYDALLAMTFQDNWVAVGSVSVEDAVEAASNMFRGLHMIVGSIFPVAWATIPDGYLQCDGSSHARVDYPNLYSVLPAVFILDADHFVVPDLGGRTVIGENGTYAAGSTGGETDHTLTTGEMPAHSHTTGNSLLLGTSVPPPLDALGPNPLPAFTGSEGGSGSHNNMQPYMSLIYVIVAQ